MDDLDEEAMPHSVRRIAVCRTDECPVADTGYEVTLYGPNYTCVCGRCGQPHTELIEV